MVLKGTLMKWLSSLFTMGIFDCFPFFKEAKLSYLSPNHRLINLKSKSQSMQNPSSFVGALLYGGALLLQFFPLPDLFPVTLDTWISPDRKLPLGKLQGRIYSIYVSDPHVYVCFELE